ncbi:nucleoside recognition domain-containing protein [Pedobacter heparinus]|uniref:Nucleoside recognition domain protein n=1 Tax=Pedobacter heparinus (strain ATCC 13125 / DSM 2366 / CIP 104194 / JCM 7457 / NBRC 12017 / NCIMB 9290 / NRRL B-14731 / HIM 762-3) TaxID=485917 RepID=C6Y082_PEDHD|nr:nucleoside recognition domain-containing protein [Pedobacter heparinus]ACU04794.1 nucleoside recognition domain protein [Pedobacter heparinus DSM 2366]
MALSRIWSAFIIVAIVVASVKCFFFGQSDIFNWMVIGKADDATNPLKLDGIIQTCWVAVELCLKLIGILALFMGLMSIAERAGGIRLLSRIVGPFFSKLFPDIPKGHPSMGHMIMNFSANLLGLDNAATPFGLKAMESLQELNPSKDVASNSQIMFLCLHAAGLNLIPVSVIAIRASQNASNPTDIFIPCLIVTFVGTIAAMLIVSFKQKINILQPVIILWVLSISLVIALLVLYIVSLNAEGIKSFSGILSNGLILLVFLLIILGGLYKKIDVFDAFIDGAKNGFDTAIKIVPYLVGMLVAISLLRTSGTFDVVISTIKSAFAFLGADTRFVEGLPTALIRPLSGGAARGMMVSTMETYGPDSFASRLSGIFQGASDTTFYIIAVYFGSVSIKNTRYAIGAMLLADLVGVCTAIGMAYLFFG